MTMTIGYKPTADEIPETTQRMPEDPWGRYILGVMRSALLLTSAVLLLSPALASAQSLGGLGDTTSFSVSVSPQYPAPLSTATLSFVSSMIDLTNATMKVAVNGKEVYAGSVHPVTIQTGKTGVPATIAITMLSAGTTYARTLVLQPEEVSLVAEPLSSAPVLYPGKPLVPLEGSTRMVAVAHFADAGGRTIDPSTLSYIWTVDGAEIDDYSGIGKQVLLVASPVQYRMRTVSVLVQSQTGTQVGQASLNLAPQAPVVRIYANDPLLGIRYEQALTDSYAIHGTESSLYAEAFSLPLINGSPILQWFLNGTKAQTGPMLTLRPTGTGQGSASLSLTATTNTDSLTEADASLSILFGTKPTTNFFGL